MALLDRLSWPFRPAKRSSFALNELDLRLAEWLGHERNGFFIEAGANDGLAQSNSLYFERYLGWRGLLVEPIPTLAQACRRNRPKAIVENAALVPFDFTGDAVEMRYCDLMSVVKGGMRSAAEERDHIAAGCEVQQVASYELVVPACTLQSILDRHRIASVDLLVLDVEGFEAKVLQGIDFDRFTARNLLVEARYRDEVEAALAGRYKAVASLSHHDVLYRPTPR
jgi:FkbM family methyltransferase